VLRKNLVAKYVRANAAHTFKDTNFARYKARECFDTKNMKRSCL